MLCDPMDYSMPGFPVHHQLSESTKMHVHCISDAIKQSLPLIYFSFHLQSFPASGYFSVSQFFGSGDQSIGVSASASILPMNIQDWFPLVLTGWISFLGDWNENWSFPVLWLLLSFPDLLAYWVQHFHNIIFQDLKYLNWNSITSSSFVHSDAS